MGVLLLLTNKTQSFIRLYMWTGSGIVGQHPEADSGEHWLRADNEDHGLRHFTAQNGSSARGWSTSSGYPSSRVATRYPVTGCWHCTTLLWLWMWC